MAYPSPTAAPPLAMPTSTLELSVKCYKLADKDVSSKSDPLCVLFRMPRGTNKWVEVGRTERQKDNLNPEWTTKVLITD